MKSSTTASFLTVSFVSMTVAIVILLTSLSGFADHLVEEDPEDTTVQPDTQPNIQLGAFSTSLSVKDIKASKAFYEKLGFAQAGGNLEQNWLILRNGSTTIGLFQGMFERNIMTFNPGWNETAETLEQFQDVRELQGKLKERGVKLLTEAEVGETGPASFTLEDPDGNQILIDQHVPRAE